MCSVKSRWYVELDQAAQKEVRFLLRQTTNLWNCIVAHVGNDVLEIARSSKDTPRVTQQINDMIQLTYRILILGEDHGLDFNMSEYWKRRVTYIRQLPAKVRENRISDLIQAYVYAHTKHVNDVEYPYHPGMKECGSTETARFCPENWKLNDQKVTLTLSQAEVSFKAPGIEKMPPGRYLLTLTKKRPGRVRDLTHPKEVKRSSYYISLSNG